MTKKDAVAQLMKQFPRDFRRSKEGKANEKFFNQVLECKSYFWPDRGILVEHSTYSDYKITQKTPIIGLSNGAGIIMLG